ncbi:hypothetical protein Clacol_003587 [Clathrus columnatus]|uniref:ribonuclease T2 n=1 Tax=Clathrus columnatus TaxID=1419009 RepID=A0AAV5A8T1_9AGAM|nr:hypothetical protein Clacol_003587 [Clathrus columnatus]
MKVNEFVLPAISLLKLATNNNFSLTSLSGGVDFSDPKVESILLSDNNGGSGGSPGSGDEPLVPSVHHGRELRFHYKSHSHQRKSTADQCPQPPILSCSPEADSTDSCCVVNPGGVLVHTQFWDLDEGLPDFWGIHGLWPDKCNGQFYENCDHSREYSGQEIVSAMQRAGAQSTLDYMTEHWVAYGDATTSFWVHEWKTHGTCVSTLEPHCFENYEKGDEVPYYFETVVALFKQFDVHGALAAANILPSSSQQYRLVDMQKAVQDATGYVPDFPIAIGSIPAQSFHPSKQLPKKWNQISSQDSRATRGRA